MFPRAKPLGLGYFLRMKLSPVSSPAAIRRGYNQSRNKRGATALLYSFVLVTRDGSSILSQDDDRRTIHPAMGRASAQTSPCELGHSRVNRVQTQARWRNHAYAQVVAGKTPLNFQPERSPKSLAQKSYPVNIMSLSLFICSVAVLYYCLIVGIYGSPPPSETHLDELADQEVADIFDQQEAASNLLYFKNNPRPARLRPPPLSGAFKRNSFEASKTATRKKPTKHDFADEPSKDLPTQDWLTPK